MTRISKHKLQPAHVKKLYKELARTVSQLNASGANLFLNELLGEEEKIMVAKRFAAIVMLLENNSIYRTAQLLHMSPSTVERLKKNLLTGKYEHIQKILKKNKKEYEAFWETLEIILRAGMPPRGKGRWKSTFEILGRK